MKNQKLLGLNSEQIALVLSTVILGMYLFTFFAFLGTTFWANPDSMWLDLSEKWLMALTPLVGVVIHRYVRSHTGEKSEKKSEL